MLHVPQVIYRQFLECHHWKVSDETRRAQLRLRNAGQHVREQPIVTRPELHQLRPRQILIALHPHAAFLIVSRETHFILQKRANKSLMIVRCRVDQMPEDLLA